MVSGTDCHGTPITVESDKRGVSPQEIVDEYDPKVRILLNRFKISFDLFTTTTTKNHYEVTKKVFLRLYKNGFIIKQSSEQYYSIEEKKFLPDRYVEGECPHCGAKEQRADQCENCGRTLGMGELINPKSKLTGSEVVTKSTEHYFIDFPKLENQLTNYVNDHEGIWKDWVWNETKGWLQEGLHPRAITRDLDWGVPIPYEEIDEKDHIDGIKNKRFYVWFDAVIGYVSATIEWAKKENKNWEDYWKNNNVKHYYFVGQDNLAFHTIFWPGQIMGQEEDLNLPYFPNVHKFLNLEGKKFSKSRGLIIDPIQVADVFGEDAVRYYLTSILPENKSTNWNWKEFQQTINSRLVGTIGNFIHRTLVFYNNKIINKDSSLEVNKAVISKTKESFTIISENISKNKFVAALQKLEEYASFGNQYFDKQKPWEILREDEQKAAQIINDCLYIVYNLRTLLHPFVPHAQERLSALLSLPAITQTNEDIFVPQNLPAQFSLADEIIPIFNKIEDEKLEPFLLDYYRFY